MIASKIEVVLCRLKQGGNVKSRSHRSVNITDAVAGVCTTGQYSWRTIPYLGPVKVDDHVMANPTTSASAAANLSRSEVVTGASPKPGRCSYVSW